MNRRQMLCAAAVAVVAPGTVLAEGVGFGGGLLPGHKKVIKKLYQLLADDGYSDAAYSRILGEYESFAMDISENLGRVTSTGVLEGTYKRLTEAEVNLQSIIRDPNVSERVKSNARVVLQMVKTAKRQVLKKWEAILKAAEQTTENMRKVMSEFKPSPIVDWQRGKNK